MKYKHILLLALSAPALMLQTSLAQAAPPTRTVNPAPPAQNAPVRVQSFKFESADIDTVMAMYCEWTGKMYLKPEGVTANISLKADKLSIPECIDAVEAILAMNNIALVPYGDKFVKVVQANGNPQTEGGPIVYDPDQEYTGKDRLVTQLIPLRNVQIQDVQTAIQHIMHAYGKIQTLEGSNSMLVTDTESNILRIRELVEFIDQASARIEPRIYEIQYAEAADIASKLEQIVTMAQENQSSGSSASTARTASSVRTPPGVVRARNARAANSAPAKASVSSSEGGGGTTIISGTVKVMSDERTNIIIIFSQPENYDFFDKMIEVFDVEVEPAITFEVVNLEYADAEDLSGTLNDLVGAAQGTTSRTSGNSKSSSRSRTSSSSLNQPAAPTSNGSAGRVTPNAASTDAASIENLSKLSESTKILADARSNSILLMGRKSDIAAIKNVIASLDVMLEQVIIEAAIFEIGLNQGLEHGIQWLYKSQDGNELGGWNVNSLTTNSLKNVAAGALNYYQNVTGINTELAINLAATDSDARLLATPVIMTTDNTEAKLVIAEQRPIVTSTSTYAVSSGTRSSNYEYKDIGIQLTVTPRINPQRQVVMEIEQKADQIGGEVTIDNNSVPIVLNRQFNASIAVPDRGTVALGGLMTTDFTDSVVKIPILGDIPLLGRYLFSSVKKTETQRELLVLMTPYVMTTHEEMNEETERIYRKTSIGPDDWNWSESKLKRITKDESAYPEAMPAQASPVMEQEEAPATVPNQQNGELIDLLNSME